MQYKKLINRNQSNAVAYFTLGKSVLESKLMVESVKTAVMHNPTLSLVASRCIQNETHDKTTIKMQGTYTLKKRI